MERLKDEESTNLYIEGLPLRIDEPVCILGVHYVLVREYFLLANLDNGCFSGSSYDQK